jgi:Cu2+-exporting ATPase
VAAESKAKVACAHCGLPVPNPREADGPQFCCVGCDAVYHALQDNGLDDFYRIREMTERDAQAVGEIPDFSSEQFDSESFLEKHTVQREDGTRECDLYLEGVHCAGCVWITEQMPHFVEGVEDARLDLPRARLSVRWDPERTQLSQAGDWLSRFGYGARPIRSEGVGSRRETERDLLKKVGVSWALAGNVMLFAVVLYSGLDAQNDPGLTAAIRWGSLVLATGSVLYGGAEFFRRAWVSIRGAIGKHWREGIYRLSMDVPISLGIGVGWAHSAWATIAGQGEIWFDSIAVLIAALLTARWLQIRGRRTAGDAADRLLSLIPSTANRVAKGKQTETVPVDQLREGDVVEVLSGDAVPVDGVVVHGKTSLHRAVLTGESRPESVGEGDEVHAGENNVGSRILVRVRAAGEETRVGKLLSWVDEANRRRAPIVQWADKLGGIFVLITLVAAAITGVVWASIAPPAVAVSHVVALLVVACPCALGMATPLALAVGVGRAAGKGIYIKHDDVLQAFAEVSHVVLDKTGTLTKGDMVVEEVLGSTRCAEFAAALEYYSHHPLAKAIREAFGGEKSSVDSDTIEETPGAGISGRVSGRNIFVGKLDWVRAKCSETRAGLDKNAVGKLLEQGLSPVAVGVDGELTTIFGIGDPLRPESRKFIERLRREGVEPVILSGDHPEVVQAIARRLGVDEACARGGVTPEQKHAFVVDLMDRAKGRVAMVGDGVNDTAALQAADIGVAVNGGAEASLVAADVFTTRHGLEPVWELLQGSRDVVSVVRRNLRMSAGYNAVAVFAAAFGLIGPLVAAFAMPASSVAVVLSSLLQASFDRQESLDEAVLDQVDSPTSEVRLELAEQEVVA